MSTEQIIAAKSLFKLGKSFAEIAAILALPTLAVRVQLDGDYWRTCRDSARQMRQRKMMAAVLRARRNIPDYEARDVTAWMMGDPLFERSALYRKQRGLE